MLCAVVAVLVAADQWMNMGRVHNGVEVGAVDLGGKTPREAREILEERVAGELQEIKLRGPEGVIRRSANDMGIAYRIEATIDRAYAVGREGSLPERISERFQATYGTVTVLPEADYRPEKARSELERIASNVNAESREAAVEIEREGARVTSSREGYEMDVEATAENLAEAVRSMSGETEIAGKVLEPELTTAEAETAAGKARKAMDGELVFVSGNQRWTVSPAALGASLDIQTQGGDFRVVLDREKMHGALGDVYAALTVEPVEAGYSFVGSGVSVTPGKSGWSIETKKLLDAVETGVFEDRREYRVTVTVDEPDLTTAEAEKAKPTGVIGEYQTDYTWDTDPGRRSNMAMASDAINGAVLAPGEVFSYNALAEPLDYEEAKVINRGRVDYADGGGLSQVSSTLYMAANYAGFEILEAHPHSAELPYIQPGLDTTVWFGALDLRFTNTTSSYVVIRQWQGEDGYNHAQIWGRPDGTEVTMSSEKVYDGVDEEGKPTTRWIVYKNITRDGEVLFDGVFREVTYKELDPYKKKRSDGG